jgi:hypothetical protein
MFWVIVCTVSVLGGGISLIKIWRQNPVIYGSGEIFTLESCVPSAMRSVFFKSASDLADEQNVVHAEVVGFLAHEYEPLKNIDTLDRNLTQPNFSVLKIDLVVRGNFPDKPIDV